MTDNTAEAGTPHVETVPAVLRPAARPVAKHETKPAGLVKMTRDPARYPAPHAADVHPAEVDNYAAGGWVKHGADRPAKG